MSQVSPAALLKALATVGFEGRQAGGSHIFLVYKVDGKKTRIHTVVTMHGKDFGNGRISDYLDQLGLDRAEFDRLLDGSMTAQEYRRIVTARGMI